jgi:hypothetical protein
MGNRVDTIDPKDVSVVVGGNIIEGFANDKIKVTRVSNQSEDEVGSDGDVARRLTNDRRGEITITLLQTSRSNDFLSLLARADEAFGAGQVPVIIKDNRGTSIYTAPNAWVQKQADSEHGAKVAMRVWVFRTNLLDMAVGGAA